MFHTVHLSTSTYTCSLSQHFGSVLMFSHLKRANTEHLFEKVGRSRKCSTINNTVGERLAHFDHRYTAFLNILFSLHCRFQNTLS